MSIWNKILVGFVLAFSLLFFYLGARALQTHQYWRSQAAKLELDLSAAEQERARLMEGDETSMGLREANLAMHKVLVDRGRVWRNCAPQAVQGGGNQAVTLSLTTDLPSPPGIPVKAVLYIFEEKDVRDGGSYLGEFIVTNVGGNVLQLAPSKQLDARELQRLQKSQGPWSLYELMPADQHEVLADLDESELRAMFPASTVDEYLADRQRGSAEASSPDASKPSRRLRDYGVLFGEHHRQRSMWIDQTAAATRDIEYLEAALADGKQQEQFRRDEIARLEREKAQQINQRDIVASHLQTVQTKLAELQTDINGLMDKNRWLAAEIARIQLEAARQIDQQSQRMAQASGGR